MKHDRHSINSPRENPPGIKKRKKERKQKVNGICFRWSVNPLPRKSDTDPPVIPSGSTKPLVLHAVVQIKAVISVSSIENEFVSQNNDGSSRLGQLSQTY